MLLLLTETYQIVRGELIPTGTIITVRLIKSDQKQSSAEAIRFVKEGHQTCSIIIHIFSVLASDI